MRYFYLTAVLSSVLLASACGTVMKGQMQEITLRTPGTDNAKCIADNGVRYTIVTDQTITIMRSGKDLVLECYAAGNRDLRMTVESGFNNWSAANIANALVPGVTYDHLSKGLYEYPPTIVADFSGMKSRSYETPDYHDKDMPNPYEQQIEDYTPSTPRIENDSNYMHRGVKKFEGGVNSNPFAVSPALSETGNGDAGGNTGADSSSSSAPASQMPVLKGDTAESLTRSANPAVFQK